jgi:radical SAM superfamily enzyme YgiQ (UPF0313 family)
MSGFGEKALVVLLKYLFSNGESPKFDSNLSNKKQIINADKMYPAYPSRELLIEYEDRDFVQPKEWIVIETSRGCVFECDFCSFPILGVKEDYTRSQEDFEIQIKTAHDKWGTTKFTIVDSTFNDRIDKISKYADVVERLDFKPLFGGYIRADLLINRPEDRDELLRMNFLNHYHGIETFNPLSAKSIHKGYNPDKMKEGLKEVRDFFVKNAGNDYVGCVGLIIGLQYETKESMDKTIHWLEDNWRDQAHSISPLFLWRPEFTNNTSSMSLNYTKYGYSEMSPSEAKIRSDITNIKLSYDSDPSVSYYEDEGVTAISEVVWKNENMDIFDAYRLSSDYNERLGWWRDNHFSEGINVVNEISFLENYKQKKLGI